MRRLEKIQMNRVGRFFCSTEWIVYENDIPLRAAYHVECQNVNLSFDIDTLEDVHEEIKTLLEYIENDFSTLITMSKSNEIDDGSEPTMSKPTEEGYYWFREHEYNDFEPVKVVRNDDGELWVRHFSGFAFALDSEPGDGDEWGGECL